MLTPDQLAIASGANATFDNRASEAEQLNAIRRITAGRFCRVVDASAQAAELAVKALVTLGTGEEKYFATVDDWFVSSTQREMREVY